MSHKDIELSSEFEKIVDKCYNNEQPPCTCACPFGLDITEFISRLKKGKFSSAYSLYQDHVLFPEIVSRICDQPCQEKCFRKGIDDAISIRKLEKASLEFNFSNAPKNLNLPQKNSKIAIIGGGVCGLSCTLKLASHGYHVTVFEKSTCIGGSLENVLPSDIFLTEFHDQMQFISYELLLNTEIKNIEELEKNFDAILIATGKNGNSFDLLNGLNSESLGSQKDGVFLAGGVTGTLNPIRSIENGIRVSQSIESYLQINRMHEMFFVNKAKISRLKINATRINSVKCIENSTYTETEAIQEASRCLLCNCNECIKSCNFMSYYNKTPKALAEDMKNTLNGTLMNVDKRMINSCSVCGSCEAVCDEHIDTGKYLLEARRLMHQKKILPLAFHDYFIRDMNFSNSDSAYLFKNAPSYEDSEYVFFPGCQLGASDPRYVELTYKYLLSKNPKTGILIGCCGVPAQWAGDVNLSNKVIDRNCDVWTDMGKPKVIFACPTCEKTFASRLPEAERISLYEVIENWGLPETALESQKKVSIFDPCASRYNENMQTSVRKLMKRIGFDLVELPYNSKMASCCGNGGQIYATNPDLFNSSAKRSCELSENPYITYCINCRDIFINMGKPSYHVLDIMFNLNLEPQLPLSLSRRRRNREVLKANLLEEIWQEDYMLDPSEQKLIISEELLQKLNSKLILDEDILNVIEYCESTGNKLLNPKTGEFIGHLKQGIITYWVTYKVEDNCYRVSRAYSHRAVIDGE